MLDKSIYKYPKNLFKKTKEKKRKKKKKKKEEEKRLLLPLCFCFWWWWRCIITKFALPQQKEFNFSCESAIQINGDQKDQVPENNADDKQATFHMFIDSYSTLYDTLGFKVVSQ